MKTVLSFALVASVTTDFTIGSPHEVLPENPHIELEVTAPAKPASQTSTLASRSDSEPLGRFRWKTFHREMLKANTAKDKFAMNDALLTTARALVRDRHAIRPPKPLVGLRRTRNELPPRNEWIVKTFVIQCGTPDCDWGQEDV